jgi:general stress protein YciG
VPHSRAQRVEAGRIGGHAVQASMSPEQRREVARKGHLVSAVNAVVDRAPELAEDQVGGQLRHRTAPPSLAATSSPEQCWRSWPCSNLFQWGPTLAKGSSATCLTVGAGRGVTRLPARLLRSDLRFGPGSHHPVWTRVF